MNTQTAFIFQQQLSRERERCEYLEKWELQFYCSPIVIAHPNLLMLHYYIFTTVKHTVLLLVFWMKVLCE